MDGLDTRPYVVVLRGRQLKQRSRKPNDDISIKTRFKAGNIDLTDVIYKSSIQDTSLRLYDKTKSQGQRYTKGTTL
jgi:hypothetical protein